MTAITDDREVARDKFRCMDCRGKYTLHTHHGFGYITATWSRPGPVPRYLAGGLLRALTDGTKWKSSIDKKCWNDVVLASMSLVWTPAMTPWPWRRSDRTFRARDLDLHRTLSRVGALRRCSRGAVSRSRVRARRRAVGLRGWGSIVPIHTRPTVVWRRSPGATGSNGTTSQILVRYT